ncbi:MAG: hypothetical protein K2X77_10940 [Candidatus Obscuribacterales bacterium]|nr:hypothetical protein [Candidatus Obscuribacterales bacterium]
MPAFTAHKTITRELVLYGTDGQQPSKTKVLKVRSECRFDCPDQKTLEHCVDQIRISDEHLRNRPEELVLWGWNCTFVERTGEEKNGGGVVILGVNWYDEKFFEEHLDSYMNPSHLAKYLEIGIPKGGITVEHWKLIGNATL